MVAMPDGSMVPQGDVMGNGQVIPQGENPQPQVTMQQETPVPQDNNVQIQDNSSKPNADIKSIVSKLIELPQEEAAKYISQLPPDIQPQVTKAIQDAKNSNYQGQGYVEAQKIALKIMQLPDEAQRQAILNNIPSGLREKVVNMMEQLKPDQQKEVDEATKTDMRPMPEQRPPRRDSLK
jgi:hypothetical protein